jgi:hypothetical protein
MTVGDELISFVSDEVGPLTLCYTTSLLSPLSLYTTVQHSSTFCLLLLYLSVQLC